VFYSFIIVTRTKETTLVIYQGTPLMLKSSLKVFKTEWAIKIINRMLNRWYFLKIFSSFGRERFRVPSHDIGDRRIKVFKLEKSHRFRWNQENKIVTIAQSGVNWNFSTPDRKFAENLW
jgi:hypothetical protein